MSRSPFDLSFDDLIAAGAAASSAAIEEAECAGVEIAALESAPLATQGEGAQTAPRRESA